MKNYAFPLKKRTIKSRLLGAIHSFKKIFLKKRDISFPLKNIPLTYWVLSNTFFSKQLTKFGSYEAENSNWILDKFAEGKGKLFVDVGANFGWYSLIFSFCAKSSGRVIAIEPEPENLRLLQKNILTNNAENITVIASGVGASEGVAELSLSEQWNPGMHSLRQNIEATDKVKIRVSTLDEVLKNIPGEIDLLKMDIEGFEVDALLGANETLARTQRALVEYTPNFIKACGRDPLQLLSIFENHHFKPYVMKEGKLELASFDYLTKVNETFSHMKNPQVDIFYIKS